MNFELDAFLDWALQPMVLTTFAIVFATLTANVVARYFFRRIEERAKATKTIWDDALVRTVNLPLALLIWVLGIGYAIEVISAGTDSGLAELIDPVRYIAIVGLIALFAIRFIREAELGFIQGGADITTAQALGKLLRISVLVTSGLTILQTLGVSIAGILTFGGIGGIVAGLAAQDLLANFFGGLMVYLDRPFAVGEWIRSSDKEIEGTVEDIGWRLTVVRTFDQRPLYIPNRVFNTIAVENPSRMRNRRIHETIGVRYSDIGALKAIIDDVRQMLIDDPDIETDQRTLIVNFNSFGPSSLDFFVYTFTKTTVWVEFHHIKQRILLEIAAIIEKHGAEVAFPTRTLHLASPEPEPDLPRAVPEAAHGDA